MPPDQDTADLACSFCGKKATEVNKLIAGPSVFICGECVLLCVSIVAEFDAAAFGRIVGDARASMSAAQFEPPPRPDATATTRGQPQTVSVFVPLRGKADEAWVTAQAERLSNGNYRILGSPPVGQHWEFAPGTAVRCARITSPGGEVALAAIERA